MQLDALRVGKITLACKAYQVTPIPSLQTSYYSSSLISAHVENVTFPLRSVIYLLLKYVLNFAKNKEFFR